MKVLLGFLLLILHPDPVKSVTFLPCFAGKARSSAVRQPAPEHTAGGRMGVHWGLPARFQDPLPHPRRSQRPGFAPSLGCLLTV